MTKRRMRKLRHRKDFKRLTVVMKPAAAAWSILRHRLLAKVQQEVQPHQSEEFDER